MRTSFVASTIFVKAVVVTKVSTTDSTLGSIA